jgi:hypothetical protein
MRDGRLWLGLLAAAALAAVGSATGAARHKVWVADVVADEPTRPTFIEEGVLKMLPDEAAATVLARTSKLAYSESSHVKDHAPAPSSAKLRFREMIKVANAGRPTPLVSRPPVAEQQAPAPAAATFERGAEGPARNVEPATRADPDDGYGDGQRMPDPAAAFFQGSNEDSYGGARYQQQFAGPQLPPLRFQQAPLSEDEGDPLDEDMDVDLTPAQMAVDEMEEHQKQYLRQQQQQQLLLQQRQPQPQFFQAQPQDSSRFRFQATAASGTAQRIMLARMERARERRALDGRDRAVPQLPEGGAPPALLETQERTQVRAAAAASEVLPGQHPSLAELALRPRVTLGRDADLPEPPAMELPPPSENQAPAPANELGLPEELYVPPAPGLLVH